MSDVRLTVSGDTSRLEADVRRALARGDHKLSLDTKNFSRPLGQITGELGEFGKSLEASNARVLAFGASAGAIYAVGAAIRESVEAAVNLEKQLAEINVILGTSQKQLLGFGNQLFQIAKDTGQAFNEVAEGAKELARQGLGMTESLKRTSDALILSRLTGLAAADAVNTLTAAINGYSQAALTSSQVTNKIIAVDQAFAVSGKDLAEALKRVGSTAAAAGVSFDELLGVVTAAQQITARGGSVIGNSFKTIFTRLQRPRTIEALDALGIATKDASGAMLPLMQVMTNLAKEFDGLSQAQQSNIAQLVGGVFQINVLKAALSDLGREYSIFGRATSISASATDEANRRNAELNKTLAAQLNALVQNVTRVGAVIGKLGLEPALKRAVGLLNSFLDRIDISDSESIGAKIGSGVLNGLGNFLSGPGLLILGAGVYKLFGFLTAQAKDALKTILQANTALGQRKQSEQAIVAVLQQDKELVAAITSKTITHAEAVERVRKSIVAATIAQRELNAVAAAAVAGGVGVGRPIRGGGGRAAGYMPNFARDEFRSEEAMAQALGASSGVKAHKSKGTIGGRKFVMNNQEIEIPNFGRNGDSAVIPQYYKGFIPNFADVTVKSLSAQYPRVRRTLQTNPNVEQNDIVNIPSMRVVQLTRDPKESELDYEKRAIKEVKAIDSRRRMKYGGSAAVDGFMGKGGRTFVEVKGGSYSKKKVKEKFGRGLLENAGVRSSGQMGMFAKAFKEKEPDQTDRINLNRPILVAATKGGSFATGFIPNFARKENPLKTALMGGTATAGPALQALMSDPQGARKLAGVLQGGARGGASGLQVSPEVRGMIAEAFPNIGQRSAMRTAQRAVAAAERHSGPRLNVLGLNTLGNRSISKPGIREFGFRDPRIRKNFERGFNRRYLMFARGLAGDMLKGIPNQRKMMKAFTSRPPDPAATGQVKGRVFESIVSGMVTGMPTRMKGNEAVDLGRGTRIKNEFASLFTRGASKIGTGMEIRLGGAGGITSADARDKLRRFRGRASGYLPNFAFLEELGSAMAAEEAGMRMSGKSGKARFGTDPRVGPMVYSSFQGTPAQAINEHLRAGQKFSTLKNSGKALRAAGYIPNFATDAPSLPDDDERARKEERRQNRLMNLSFGLSFAGAGAAELAKGLGHSDKVAEEVNNLSSNLGLAATAAMLIPGPAGMVAGALMALGSIYSFAKKQNARANTELIKAAEASKAEFQELNDSVGQYSSTMQQYRDAMKASRPDPQAIMRLENKLQEIASSLPASFQSLILATNDVTQLQNVLAQAIDAEAKRVQSLQSAGGFQEKINESFGKIFGAGKIFDGTEGKLFMKQMLDDTKKSMDFGKFSKAVDAGNLNLAGKSTQEIITELKNVYGLSEDMAMVFADLAGRGEQGEKAMRGLIDQLIATGKSAAITSKQLEKLQQQQKAQIAFQNARKKGETEALTRLKLVNKFLAEQTKLYVQFTDAVMDSAKRIKFAQAEMAITKAQPFLTEEAQAQLDFQMSKAQAKDANIQANKEGVKTISQAFLEGVESLLDADNRQHQQILTHMQAYAEVGKLPALLNMVNDNLMQTGQLDRNTQMQLAALANSSNAEMIALLERNNIKLDEEIKIAGFQYDLAKQQAQLQRDLKAGGGLDQFLDPDALGKNLGDLGKNIDMFTTASQRGDRQQRGRSLLGILDHMMQSGRMAGLDERDPNDAQTIRTIAMAQGEALRMQFISIERMLMQAFRQTGDNSLIPLIRIMRKNAQQAYQIAREQLMERLKSRRIPEATLTAMRELNKLLNEQQKAIRRDQNRTAVATEGMLQKFPLLQTAFGTISQFFSDMKTNFVSMGTDIGFMLNDIERLPHNIAQELGPLLQGILAPVIQPLQLGEAIKGDQKQLEGLKDQLNNIVDPAKVQNFAAGKIGDLVTPRAQTMRDQGDLRTAFNRVLNVYGKTTQLFKSLDGVAKELAKMQGVDFDNATEAEKKRFRKSAAGRFGFEFGDTLRGEDEYFASAKVPLRGSGDQQFAEVQRVAGQFSTDTMNAFISGIRNALKTEQGKQFLESQGAFNRTTGEVDFQRVVQFDTDKMLRFLETGGINSNQALMLRGGLESGGVIRSMLNSMNAAKDLSIIFNRNATITEMARLGMLTARQVSEMRSLNQQIRVLNDRIRRNQQMQAGFGNLSSLQAAGVDMTGVAVQQAGPTSAGAGMAAGVGAVGTVGAGGTQLTGVDGKQLIYNTSPYPALQGKPFTGIPAGGGVQVSGTTNTGKPILTIFGPTGPLGTVNLQEGGIVTRRMNATLGERGPEAVIPLDRAVRGVNQTPQIESEQRSNDAYQLDVERNQLLSQMGQAIMELRAVAQSAAVANNQLLMNIAQGQIGTRNAIVAAAMQNQAIMGQMNLVGQVAGNAQIQAGQAQQQAGATANAVGAMASNAPAPVRNGVNSAFAANVNALMNFRYPGFGQGMFNNRPSSNQTNAAGASASVPYGVGGIR